MKHKGPSILGILFIFILINSPPDTDARQCNLNCAGTTGNLLKFQPGRTYQYKLEGLSETTLPGAKHDASKLGLEANVEISLTNGCEHVLKLNGAKTIGPDGKKYNLDSTIADVPIKFALQNGKITELCTNKDESLHATNIKRAVLSLIQSSVLKETGHADQHETDIFGNCPTSFEFIKHAQALVVKKTKDLIKCTHREEYVFPFSTSTYLVKSDIQAIPLLSGSYNSDQKYEAGVLKHASSEETYNYNPTSTIEAVTTVKINTKLLFIGQSDKPAPPSNANIGKTLVFQVPHQSGHKGDITKMVELLKTSCDTRTISTDGAAKFNQLVKAMSLANKEELLQVYRQVKSGQGFKEKDIAKKMFVDAIVDALSGSSVEVMAELLKNKEVTGNTAKYFYLMLGTVKRATKEALQAVTPLIDENAPTEVFLGAGALGGRFCREQKCSSMSDVDTFQLKLAAPLLNKGCKPNNKLDEDNLLASLKGLGNMKYLSKPVVAKLADNAKDRKVKARVRVALLETMRTDANKNEFRNVAGDIFKNPEEDSEIRLKAYLVLVESPNGKVAAIIKNVLENEKSFQVGTFVVSHLANLRASTNPEKSSAKHHLGSIIISDKYPIDFRKYSQNLELSNSVEMLNLGAAGESNILYSQKSYLPRSVSLNLTSFMFGHSVNWLELNLRAENVEKVLEKVLGPRGKLRKHSYNDVYDEGREFATELLERVAERYEKSLRPKRSVSRDQLNTLANKVNLHHEPEDDVDIDLSMKLYGSELFWMKYHGNENKFDPYRAVDKFFGGLEDSMESAKNLNFDYRKHFTFMDEEVSYPTGLGLTLNLKVLGSMAFRIQADGKFDVPALLKDPKNADVRLQLVPSAAVELRGDLVLDGVALEAGIKVTSNTHTSTGTDMTFRMLDGRGVDVKFGLPLNKQELFSMNSEAVSLVKEANHPETIQPITFDVKREKYSGCFDQLSELLGLTVCGEVDVPFEGHRSILPAYGPAKLSLHVDKDDDSLRTYHFKVYADEREDVKKFEILFDTPNSKTDRKMALQFEGSLHDKVFMKVNLKSPWTNALLEGAVVHDAKELYVNARFAHDDNEYYLKTGAKKTQQSNNVIRYEPLLEYKAPEQGKSALVGRRGGPKSSTQVVTVSGAIIVESNDNGKTWKYENLALTTPRTKYSIDGTGSVNKHGSDLDVVIHYDKEHVKVKGHLKNKDPIYNAQLTVLPSQYPDFNVNLKWDGVNDPKNGKYESKLSAIHGPDTNSEASKIFVHNKLDWNKKNGIYGTENTVTYPLLNIDGHIGLRVAPKSFKSELKGKFDRYSAQFLVKGECNTKKEGDYNAEVRWELMGNSVGLTMSRKVLKNHQSKFANVLEVKPGGKYELNAHVTHKHNEDDLDLSADVDVILPVDPKNLKLKCGLKQNKVETRGHLNAVGGDKQYVQGDFNIKEGDKPSGNYKLKVLDYINSHGDFVFDGTNFKAKTKIDFPKVQREMEGKSQFAVTGSKYQGTVDFCWDTKHPEKSLKLQTDTSLDGLSFDSKNSLVFGGDKTIFNIKHLRTGDEDVGTLSGAIELILPNNDKLLLTGADNRDFTNKNSLQGEALIELTLQKHDQQPNKASVKIIMKNVDVDDNKYDLHITLNAMTQDQKNCLGNVMFKSTPKDDKLQIKSELSISGSVLKEPMNFKFDSEVPKELLDDSIEELNSLPSMNYRAQFTSGSNILVENSAKVSENTFNADLTVKLPEDSPVSSLKWSTSNTFDINSDTDKHKVKSSNQLHWNNKNFIKVSGEANVEPNSLTYLAEWETNNLSKRKVSGSSHWTFEGNARKADANAALTWEGKSADVSLKMERVENNGVIHLLGNTPDHGKFDLLLKNKLVKNGKGLHSEVTIVTKDKKVSINSKVELVDQHPLIDVVIDHPDGNSRFFIKIDVKGDRHWVTEMKAKWTAERTASFSLDQEVFLKSIDNFFVKQTLDSPEDGKFLFDLGNRPGRGEGKKITFTVKRDDKVLVSGSSNYVIREDGNKKVVEGNGNLKVNDKQYPVNFKGSWQDLENDKAFKLLVKSGKHSFNVDYKHNENELNFERTYCQDGKCSKAQILHRVRGSGIEEYENTLVLKMDLHLLPVRPSLKDVSYVASYKRKGQLVDHLIESKYGDEVKFKYNGFVHEKETGLLITFPKRTMGAEVKYDLVNNKENSASNFNMEADLYLNKEKGDKLCIKSTAKVEKFKLGVVFSGETKLTHPTLKRDLSVSGKYSVSQLDSEAQLVLDVFKNEDQKILVSFNTAGVKEQKKYKRHSIFTMKSKGCKMDVLYDSHITVDEEAASFTSSEKFSYLDSHGKTRESVGKLTFSPKEVYILIKLPTVKVFEWIMKMENKGNEYTLLADTLIGTKVLKEKIVYQLDKNHAAYTCKWDGHSLNAHFGLLMSDSAHLNVDMDNKNAVDLKVNLDEENFLKSNYVYDPETIKIFWQSIYETAKDGVEELTPIFRDFIKTEQNEVTHLLQCLTNCLPEFNGMTEHIKRELKQMKEEALADEDISDAVDFLKEGLGSLLDHLTVFLEELEKLLQILGKFIEELAQKMMDVCKEIGPKVSEAVDNLFKMLASLLEQCLKLCLQLGEQALDELKKYKEDLDEMAKVITDVVHDIGRQFAKVFHALHQEVQSFVELNMEQLKELPVTNMLKEKLEELRELRLPEEAYLVYDEIVANLKQFLPTPELEEFFSALSSYLTKLLRQEQLDGQEAGKELYEKLVKAVKSLVTKLYEVAPKTGTFKPEHYVTLPMFSWLKLPVGSARSSLINLITSPDFPKLLGSIETFAPSLMPMDNLPPFDAFASIMEGSEIITFDGRHYTVDGVCSYVLAEDYVNGNFSIVGHFKDGKINGFTVWDDKHSITLRSFNTPLKDDQEAEFPLKIGQLKAWKTPNLVGLYSKAGLLLICNEPLHYCNIKVSGYYFNQVRGLFGNMNYERHDDLLLPEGKIGSEPVQFCNSWKVDSSCPDVPVVPIKRERQKICTDMFTTEESDLVLGRPWLPLGPFRDACDSLVSRTKDDKLRVACKVSSSYVFHAQQKGAKFLDIPDECAVCHVNNKILKGDDDTTTVKPGKAADIVFMVDVLKKNEDVYKKVVQPLVPKLKAELAKQGINDVHITLVSYNSPTNKWTNYHTSKGKLEFNGNDCVLEFEKKPEPRNDTWVDRVVEATNVFKRHIGESQRMKAYENVLEEFNFRPHALKTLIGVHTEPCQTESLLNLLVPIRVFINSYSAMHKGIVWNLLTPLQGLSCPKDSVNKKDVVGFSEDEMYTLTNSVKGDADHETDYCVTAALTTGGVVFPTSNLKDFMKEGKGEVVVQKMAEKLVNTLMTSDVAKEELECECELLFGFLPRTRCNVDL